MACIHFQYRTSSHIAYYYYYAFLRDSDRKIYMSPVGGISVIVIHVVVFFIVIWRWSSEEQSMILLLHSFSLSLSSFPSTSFSLMEYNNSCRWPFSHNPLCLRWNKYGSEQKQKTLHVFQSTFCAAYYIIIIISIQHAPQLILK